MLTSTDTPAPPLPAGRTWGAIALGALAGLGLIGLVVLALSRSDGGGAAPLPAGVAPPANGTVLREEAAIGFLAPQFSLPDLTGQPRSLAEWRGRPLWVNFWASWCPPCRAEMPEMKRIYAKYQAQGLVLVGVDLGESAETVRNFASQNGYDWTFVLDENQQVAQRYNITGIPTHVFIDAGGVIRQYRIGGLTPTTIEQNLATILPK